MQNLNNQSEDVQLEAVKDYGLSIKRIANSSEAVQLEAVKQNGFAIGFIKNPSEEVQLAAVRRSGCAIMYINNPSEAVQLEAVQQDGFAICNITNPSEVVQLAAVRQNIDASKYLKNTYASVRLEISKQRKLLKESNQDKVKMESVDMAKQLEAVKQDGYAIVFIKNPSEEVQLAAVKEDGYSIQYITNPSEAVQLAAVKENCQAIQSIKNPTEKVQLEAVKQSRHVIELIKNPTEKVQLEAGKQMENIAPSSESVQLATVNNQLEKVSEDLPIVPFMKLQDGKNYMRIVSLPAKFFQVRVKLPLSKSRFGDSIRSYTHEKIEELNNKLPSEHYCFFVIDRRDQKLKRFIAPLSIINQIVGFMNEKNQNLNDDDIKFTPIDFDISISFNRNASITNFYQVEAYENKTISVDDLEIINTLGSDMMIKILNNCTRMSTKKAFIKNLERLGWYPGFALDEENKKQATSNELAIRTETKPSDDSLLSLLAVGLPVMFGSVLLSSILKKR